MAFRIAFATVKKGHYYDSVISLMNECLKRDFHVYWFEFDKIKKQGSKFYAPMYEIKGKKVKISKGIISGKVVGKTNLTDMNAVYLKRDPPVNHKVLVSIKNLGSKVFIFNDPKGIIKYEEKTYLKKFKKFTPPTLFSANVNSLEKMVKRLENCVVKLSISHGGFGVYHISKRNGNFYMEDNKSKSKKIKLKQFLKKITKNGKIQAVVVEYLKNVGKGDKRILVLNGKVIGSVLRMPKKGGWVCNVKSGGTAVKTKLTKEEIRMSKAVSKIMLKDKLYIIGIDTLEGNDGKRVLSEVNSTNVGAIHIAERLNKSNLSKKIISFIVKSSRT
jgi:glutathione synthase